MGTPNYPDDFASSGKKLRSAQRDLYSLSLITAPEQRPWLEMGVSDYSYSRWPSTTSGSWASLQLIAGVRTHPIVGFCVRVQSPASGCEVQIASASTGDVLYSSGALTSGSKYLRSTLTIPADIAVYGEFRANVQAKSTSAGETTYLTVAYVHGRNA